MLCVTPKRFSDEAEIFEPRRIGKFCNGEASLQEVQGATSDKESIVSKGWRWSTGRLRARTFGGVVPLAQWGRVARGRRAPSGRARWGARRGAGALGA